MTTDEIANAEGALVTDACRTTNGETGGANGELVPGARGHKWLPKGPPNLQRKPT